MNQRTDWHQPPVPCDHGTVGLCVACFRRDGALPPGHFTTVEEVIKHAEAHGRATLVGDDGRVQMSSFIPKEDLPTCDDGEHENMTAIIRDLAAMNPVDVTQSLTEECRICGAGSARMAPLTLAGHAESCVWARAVRAAA